jgi:hypothetical protein
VASELFNTLHFYSVDCFTLFFFSYSLSWLIFSGSVLYEPLSLFHSFTSYLSFSSSSDSPFSLYSACSSSPSIRIYSSSSSSSSPSISIYPNTSTSASLSYWVKSVVFNDSASSNIRSTVNSNTYKSSSNTPSSSNNPNSSGFHNPYNI